MMVRHRIMNWMRRLFGRAAPVPTLTPLVLPTWAAWADESPAPQRRVHVRPLAAQLASQARLNVPTGRKARAASAPMPKRAPVARSVHLQARHRVVAAKPIRPTLVPVATAPRPNTTRPLRAAA